MKHVYGLTIITFRSTRGNRNFIRNTIPENLFQDFREIVAGTKPEVISVVIAHDLFLRQISFGVINDPNFFTSSSDDFEHPVADEKDSDRMLDTLPEPIIGEKCKLSSIKLEFATYDENQQNHDDTTHASILPSGVHAVHEQNNDESCQNHREDELGNESQKKHLMFLGVCVEENYGSFT